MKFSIVIALVVLLAVGPISAQRLPRSRSRLSAAEAEAAAAEKAEALKKLKSKMEAATNTSTTTTSTTPEASPPAPSPSPPPPTSSPKPSAAPSTTAANKTSTTPEVTSTSSVPPPVSSVQVRMSFAPSKKVPEERPKSATKEEDAKNKKPDTQETTKDSAKEPTKKPSPSSTSSPTTSTAKPQPRPSSTKKPDQDEELRDALKRIHQEVLKQPRNPEPKNKTTSTTTKRPPKEEKLEVAETIHVRPPVLQQRVSVQEPEPPLDAQASIQSTKFVLRDQGLQVLPSFVRSKDRRPIPPGSVRHILVQKQPPAKSLTSPLLSPLVRQRSDLIDEEAVGSTTSTTAFPHIPIVHFDKEQSADGSYKTSYETANNIFAEETGFLKNPGVEEEEALVQQGSYSYTAPDGSLISVTYTADEQGFRATGTHLPTPPPVSPEIQRSLDIIYAQIERDEEEAAREAELERQGEASETHEEKLSPPTTGSKRESRRYLPKTDDDQY